MTERPQCPDRARKLPALLVLAVSLLATALMVPGPARAGPCDQVGGVITGDWTITTAQTCTGILYTVDGTINVNAGGSLTLVDGGLRFAKDGSHAGYALNVHAGGELILDNSIVTTQTQAIDPYLKLTLTVSGANSRFAMRNNAVLKFPGAFDASGATVDIADSTITGFTATEISGLGLYSDDNDDSPVTDWASSTVSLYRSSIERIYENASAASDPGNATGVIAGNVVLRGGSALYAYDSYIGVDYSNVFGLHNELRVDATSNAYIYGGTIDRTQDPVSMSQWRPAYAPQAAGGNVYLMRWFRLTAVDTTAFPISGADVAATLSPSSTAAQFPDNGFGATPSARTLVYLGRDASTWDVTDASGVAVIPLYTDLITTASLPNAESFGNYRAVVTFGTASESTGVDFPPYPEIAEADNLRAVTLPFPDVTVRTGADLELRQSDYPGTLSVIQGQPFTVTATIYNEGQTDAMNVAIAAYPNGDRLNEIGRATVSRINVGQSVSQIVDVNGVGTLGAQTLMLVVDPNNGIPEGGVAQENNNFANVTLNVLPPPNGYVAILTPEPGQTVQPGISMSVTGYLRDENATGLVGVPLTIELKSGSVSVSSTTTTSQAAGFFQGTLTIPDTAADGDYVVEVRPASGPIAPASQQIAIRRSVSFFSQSILGLPVWLWLIVLLGVIAAVGGGTAYVKYVGLGKLVECGECGAFIPADSAKCRKCGVEFEKGMAKCSNCETWIPIGVKQCPECGVAFATGEIEIADYEAQMKRQYEDVRQRFREEANRVLGRTLTDREFADWWRTQPTFVTFEGWLREEEEMRRMGSRACPVCSTLNSVTATVCHKCGALMREDLRRPVAERPAAARPTQSQPAPTEPVPKKEVVGAPIVQKKVIRKPEDATEGGGAADAGEPL